MVCAQPAWCLVDWSKTGVLTYLVGICMCLGLAVFFLAIGISLGGPGWQWLYIGCFVFGGIMIVLCIYCAFECRRVLDAHAAAQTIDGQL